MNCKWLKILGISTTVVGTLASVVGGIVSEKKQEETISKKVAEAISKSGENK